jgi:DNA-binding winged helix-turn-helix (wHTH) protein
MILIATTLGPARTALTSLLLRERLDPKSCNSVRSAFCIYRKAPVFDVIMLDYRLEQGDTDPLLLEFLGEFPSALIVVFAAPLRAEASLLRSGALMVLGAGFSPYSAALLCSNLTRFRRQLNPQIPTLEVRPESDFTFGAAIVSPAYRSLRARIGRGTYCSVPITGLQLRFLRVLRDSPGAILEYETLFHVVWRRAYSGNNAPIRQCVSALRSRFTQAKCVFGDSVTTVHGTGYRYESK